MYIYFFIINRDLRLGDLESLEKIQKEDLQDRLKVDREDTECFKRPCMCTSCLRIDSSCTEFRTLH